MGGRAPPPPPPLPCRPSLRSLQPAACSLPRPQVPDRHVRARAAGQRQRRARRGGRPRRAVVRAAQPQPHQRHRGGAAPAQDGPLPAAAHGAAVPRELLAGRAGRAAQLAGAVGAGSPPRAARRRDAASAAARLRHTRARRRQPSVRRAPAGPWLLPPPLQGGIYHQSTLFQDYNRDVPLEEVLQRGYTNPPHLRMFLTREVRSARVWGGRGGPGGDGGGGGGAWWCS